MKSSDVGAVFQQHRLRAGVEQRHVAGALKTTAPCISRRESGITPITIEFLWEASKIIGADPIKLLKQAAKGARW